MDPTRGANALYPAARVVALAGRAVVPAVSYSTGTGPHRADEYILDAELSLCRRVLRAAIGQICGVA